MAKGTGLSPVRNEEPNKGFKEGCDILERLYYIYVEDGFKARTLYSESLTELNSISKVPKYFYLGHWNF